MKAHYLWGDKVDLLVISLKNKEDFLAVKLIPEIVKDRYPKTKILFSGPFANQNPWQVLYESKADFVCIGDDDETTILELCKKFDNPLFYDSILGLGSKKLSFLKGEFQDAIFLGNKRRPKENLPKP